MWVSEAVAAYMGLTGSQVMIGLLRQNLALERSCKPWLAVAVAVAVEPQEPASSLALTWIMNLRMEAIENHMAAVVGHPR